MHKINRDRDAHRHSSKLRWLDAECSSQGRSLAVPLSLYNGLLHPLNFLELTQTGSDGGLFVTQSLEKEEIPVVTLYFSSTFLAILTEYHFYCNLLMQDG